MSKEQGRRFSRRTFLKTAAAVTAIVGAERVFNTLSSSISKAEAKEVLQPLPHVVPKEIMVSNDGTIASICEFPDSTIRVTVGQLDSFTQKFKFKDVSRALPVTAECIAISETDSKRMAVFGESAPDSDQGRMWLTTNGGETAKIYTHDRGRMNHGRFRADNNCIDIAESNHFDSTNIMKARFTISNEAFADVPVNGGIGWIGSFGRFDPSGSNYVGYAVSYDNSGLLQLTENQTSVQATPMYTELGRAANHLGEAVDNTGVRHYFNINNYTPASNGENRDLGTFSDVVPPLPPRSFQPHTALYPEIPSNLSIDIISAGVNFAANKGLMATGYAANLGIGKDQGSYLEEFDWINPGDLSKRNRFPTTGLPQKKPSINDIVEYSGVAFPVVNGTTLTLLSAARYEGVYDSQQNQWNRVFKEGGYYQWNKNTSNWEKLVTEILVNAAPTPTASPTTSATPTETKPTPTAPAVPTSTPTSLPEPNHSTPTPTHILPIGPVPKTPVFTRRQFLPLNLNSTTN